MFGLFLWLCQRFMYGVNPVTQEALMESFVRLLHAHPANKIIIREITDLAGVGLGTFYDYFSKKEDLIALTIFMQVKQHAEQM